MRADTVESTTHARRKRIRLIIAKDEVHLALPSAFENGLRTCEKGSSHCRLAGPGDCEGGGWSAHWGVQDGDSHELAGTRRTGRACGTRDRRVDARK